MKVALTLLGMAMITLPAMLVVWVIQSLGFWPAVIGVTLVVSFMPIKRK